MRRYLICIDDTTVPDIRPTITPSIGINDLNPPPRAGHPNPIPMPGHRRKVANRNQLTPRTIHPPPGKNRIRTIVTDDPLKPTRLSIKPMQRRLLAIKPVQIPHKPLHPMVQLIIEKMPMRRPIVIELGHLPKLAAHEH